MFSQERAPTAFACSQWNIAEQHRLGTWKSLRHVEGTTEDLFLLGLTCAIPKLTITVSGYDWVDRAANIRESTAWHQVLAYARPTQVTLRLTDSDWLERGDGFMLLFDVEQLISLQSLESYVPVSYSTGADPKSMGSGYYNALQFLWAIVPSLKPINFEVTFDWTCWGEWIHESGDGGFDPDLLKDALEAVDIEHCARQFLHERSQSVRFSLMGPGGCRRDTRCFGPGFSPEERAAIIAEVV